MLRQFLRYTGAGAIGTAGHYVIMIALVNVADTGPVTASTVGATIGALLNYALNHRFTFSSTKSHVIALPKYGGVAVGGIVLNALVVSVMTGSLGLHYLLAQVVATALVLATGYIANRMWTF